MFKSTRNRRGAVLFLSSYIPLYTIIIFQNIIAIVKKCNLLIEERGLSITKIILSKNLIVHGIIKAFYFPEVYIIILLTIFSIIIKYKLKQFINFEEKNNNVKGVILLDIKNATHEYFINYFALYIFPFITLDLTSLSGLFIFAFLLFIIGRIYINNELFYVNPTLNTSFHFNLYKVTFSYNEGEGEKKKDGILLSKKDMHNLRLYRRVDIFKLPLDGLYIEKGNNEGGSHEKKAK